MNIDCINKLAPILQHLNLSNTLFVINSENDKKRILKRFPALKNNTIFLNIMFITKKMLSFEISELFKFINDRNIIFFNLDETNGRILEFSFICKLKKIQYTFINETHNL